MPRERRRFAAWFEPEHYIVERVAGFFTRRFADMDWLIATPRGSLSFIGKLERADLDERRDDEEREELGESGAERDAPHRQEQRELQARGEVGGKAARERAHRQATGCA